MAASKEVTFGAKLQRGYDLHGFISGYPNYRSARAEDSTAEFLKFLDEVKVLNTEKAKADQAYYLAADKREKAFRTGDKPLRTLVTRIGNAVKGQYGKGSKEHDTIYVIVAMIGQSAKSKTGGEVAGSGDAANGTNGGDSISRSFQSYGSLVGNFEKLIAALETLPEYVPSADDLKVEELKTVATQLRSLNNDLVPKYQSYKQFGADRSSAFDGLKDRAARIKSNVQSIFGTASVEFRSVKGLRF